MGKKSLDAYVSILQGGYYMDMLCVKSHEPCPGDDIEPVILFARAEKKSPAYRRQKEVIGKIRKFVKTNYGVLEELAAEIWGKKGYPSSQEVFVPEYVSHFEDLSIKPHINSLIVDMSEIPGFDMSRSGIVGLVGIEFYNQMSERDEGRRKPATEPCTQAHL